jgi:hypothetical protein
MDQPLAPLPFLLVFTTVETLFIRLYFNELGIGRPFLIDLLRLIVIQVRFDIAVINEIRSP